MIPVAEARTRILADVATVAPEETLPVARSLGRVLARDVLASLVAHDPGGLGYLK